MINNTTLKNIILLVSFIIPIAVAILLFMPEKLSIFGEWAYFLPHINAIINSLTSLILLLSLYMIKIKNIRMHKYLMTIAFFLGSIFLVSYIMKRVIDVSIALFTFVLVTPLVSLISILIIIKGLT